MSRREKDEWTLKFYVTFLLLGFAAIILCAFQEQNTPQKKYIKKEIKSVIPDTFILFIGDDEPVVEIPNKHSSKEQIADLVYKVLQKEEELEKELGVELIKSFDVPDVTGRSTKVTIMGAPSETEIIKKLNTLVYNKNERNVWIFEKKG